MQVVRRRFSALASLAVLTPAVWALHVSHGPAVGLSDTWLCREDTAEIWVCRPQEWGEALTAGEQQWDWSGLAGGQPGHSHQGTRDYSWKLRMPEPQTLSFPHGSDITKDLHTSVRSLLHEEMREEPLSLSIFIKRDWTKETFQIRFGSKQVCMFSFTSWFPLPFLLGVEGGERKSD